MGAYRVQGLSKTQVNVKSQTALISSSDSPFHQVQLYRLLGFGPQWLQ